jgi:DNA-binding transcriptional MerR regulator
MDNGGLITNSGVAKILGISNASVTLWTNTHFQELPTNKQGHKLYSQDDIEHFKKVKALLKKGHRHEEIKEMLANIAHEENQKVEKSKKTEEILPVKESKNNEIQQTAINISSCVLIPDAIFDKLDLKASITNEDLKYLFRRISELEEENKRLQSV